MSRPEEFLTNGGRAGSVPGYSFPSSVASLSDPRLTDWLKHTVHPFGGVAEGVTLHNLLPTGFADYARILHPARRVGTHEPVSWSEVADRLGRTMHPLVQWGRLVGTDDPYGHPDWAYSPEPGRLPEEVATHLIEVLQEHTKTPNNCLLGIWEGYGSFAGSSHRSLDWCSLIARI